MKNNMLLAELGCFILALALAVGVHWGVYNFFDRDAAASPGLACPVTFKK